MNTYFNQNVTSKLFSIVVVVILSILSIHPVYSQHPVCNAEISGASLNNTISEIKDTWKTQGLNDITCNGRMKITCEEARQKGVAYASNTSGRLEKLEDKVVAVSIDPQEKARYLSMKMRINAPDSIKFSANQSWKGWSHASLIKSKIDAFCKMPTPEGFITQCSYLSGVKIIVIEGSRRNIKCKYIFEARYRGKYGNTPPDHAIFESLERR